jgi:hypothetical protein
MKIWILVTAMVAALASPAPDQEKRAPNLGYKAMESYYGNTVVFWGKDGKTITSLIYYSPDFTYREWRAGNWNNGTFIINNGQDNSLFCLTRINNGLPFTNCHPFAPNKQIGDHWYNTQTPGGCPAPGGGIIDGVPPGGGGMSLEKGLVPPPASPEKK